MLQLLPLLGRFGALLGLGLRARDDGTAAAGSKQRRQKQKRKGGLEELSGTHLFSIAADALPVLREEL